MSLLLLLLGGGGIVTLVPHHFLRTLTTYSQLITLLSVLLFFLLGRISFSYTNSFLPTVEKEKNFLKMMGGHKRKDFVFFSFLWFWNKKNHTRKVKGPPRVGCIFVFFFFFFYPEKKKNHERSTLEFQVFLCSMYVGRRTTNQATDRVLGQVLTHNWEKGPPGTHTHARKGFSLFFVTNCCAREEEEEKMAHDLVKYIFFFFQNLAVKSCFFFFGTIRKRNNKAKEHTHTHTNIFFK